MANQIHFEARRKQMFLDRVAKAKEAALCSKDETATLQSTGDLEKSCSNAVMCTDQGQFYQTRQKQRKGGGSYSSLPREEKGILWRNNLTLFRVNLDGHNNRYRNRQHLAPHCDSAYSVLYPEKDNPDYTEIPNRTLRKENSFVDSYEISKKVNGTLKLKMLTSNDAVS